VLFSIRSGLALSCELGNLVGDGKVPENHRAVILDGRSQLLRTKSLRDEQQPPDAQAAFSIAQFLMRIPRVAFA
jgi:hypothetical protein